MEKICHFSTTNKYITWFNDDWSSVESFLNKHKLDGIELGLTLDYTIDKIPKSIVKGVHLSFFPMWLEFWNGDMNSVSELIGSEHDIIEYYGGTSKQAIVETYKKQFERAKLLEAQYMVFHVCHIRPKDSFTWQFSYSNKQVINAAIEIINEVFPQHESGPKLLFENLWWPGLTFMDGQESQLLLDGVKYNHKGFVLDISHLTLTNPKIATEQMCFNYIKKVLNNLGDIKNHIDVVHLNKTLPNHYMRQNQSYKLERYSNEANKVRKHQILMEHVNKLDPHEPFDHPLAKDIVELINPKYCVYETNPKTINELNYFIKKQNVALGMSY
ncbi:MAG: xylose isomerase [Epulopiscium sp. Nele67-Bin002]|nr:MAG: xylose isomerase [Epulopiscium sp. Nele67-Bin002]